LKILIFGLPGSGKSTLAKPLAKLLGGVWINADAVRKHYNDWDFSPDGRVRQATRMSHLADGVILAGRIAVADFVAPTAEIRDLFKPDFSIWMDTIPAGRFEDTNQIFEKPERADYHVSAWFSDTHKQLSEVVQTFIRRQNQE
jgi:adenylylsulfate kinase